MPSPSKSPMPLNDPVRGDGAEARLARDRGPVHQPEVDLPAAAVAPQDIALAIAIEITLAQNVPAGGDGTRTLLDS